MHSPISRRINLGLAAVLLSGLLTACSVPPAHRDMNMTPVGALAAEMQMAPTDVRTAYQFASANPHVSMNVPCYCGCVSIGHTSNFQCYVSRIDADRTITYDPHALNCATCVDITQDSMRLWAEGRSIPDIRAYVDATYAGRGPSTMQ
jgi:hypothetical protein